MWTSYAKWPGLPTSLPKGDKEIWLPFKNHFLSQDALRTIKEIETLDTYIGTPTIENKRFPDVDKLCQVALPSYLST